MREVFQTVARAIEQALLRPDATAAEIEGLCLEARTHGFHGACVLPSRVALARHRLEGCEVRVVAAIGFPLGGTDADTKRFETEAAIDEGAQEIDVVMNLGRFKDGDHRYVLRELRDVVEAADERPVKVILETGYLTPDEVRRACALVVEADAQFVKTCTGFGPRGVTVDDVKLLRAAVGAEFGVKAAGGIRDAATARALLAAGANRIGTSSGVAIVRELGEPIVL